MKKIKDKLLSVLGVILLVLGILAFYNAFVYKDTASFLWFSYTALILIGFGVLRRNSYLIASQLNIIFIPYIVWNIDFFYVLFTGSSLWGITDYFFHARPFLTQIVTIQHIFIIPVSLFALWMINLKRKDFWKFSAIQVIIFFFLVRIFTAQAENINCAFKSCLPFAFSDLTYSVLWFLAYGIMIAITTFLLTKVKIFNKD